MFQFTVTSCTCPGKPLCDDGVVFGGILLSFLTYSQGNVSYQPLCWGFSNPSGYLWISNVSGVRRWLSFPCLSVSSELNASKGDWPFKANSVLHHSYWPNTQHQFLLPFSKVPYFFDFMWTGLLLSWQTPSHPCNPLKLLPFLEASLFRNGVQKLLAPPPPSISHWPPCLVYCVCGCDSPGRERTSL